MNGASSTRRPHAVLDLASRNCKADKIAHLLDLPNRPQPPRLLEIGTGSGGIAHWFAIHATRQCEVTAVDVCDNRLVHDGYSFQMVADVELPFDGASFDAVISNHVIEHVGDANAQQQHLNEVRRVMKSDGVGYLAVPNRWMLTEPHYRLMFFSWWPRAWRTPYLRLWRKDEAYDCEPLQMRQLERMLGASRLAGTNRYRRLACHARYRAIQPIWCAPACRHTVCMVARAQANHSHAHLSDRAHGQMSQ